MKIRIREHPITSDRKIGSGWHGWRGRVLEATLARDTEMREWYHLGVSPASQGVVDYMDHAIEAPVAFDAIRAKLPREVSEVYEYWMREHAGLNHDGVFLIFPWEACDRIK